MGICCTGKQTKSDFKNDDIIRPNNLPKESKSSSILSSNLIPNNAGINYEIQQNILNINISQLITTTNAIINPNSASSHNPQLIDSNLNDYNNLFDNNKTNANLPIEKTNIEYLWNVFIEYKDDFTSCNIINLDLRKSKPENFLKKMKKINYSIDEMIHMNSARISNFKRYLYNKTVIIILENDMIDQLSKIIQFFYEKQFTIISYKILNSNLNTDNMSVTEKHLYNTLDQQSNNSEYYPFILLSFRYLSHIKTENYIFFQRVNMSQIKNCSKYKFIPEYLSNSHLSKEDPYLGFYIDFKLNFILKVTNGVFSETTSEFKRCKTENAAKNAFNSVLSCLAFTSVEDKPKALDKVFEKIKREVSMNQSVIVLIDDTFSDEVVFEFIILLIWKVSYLPINLIIEYLALNVSFIPNVKSLYQSKQVRIDELLNNTYKW